MHNVACTFGGAGGMLIVQLIMVGALIGAASALKHAVDSIDKIARLKMVNHLLLESVGVQFEVFVGVS